MQITRQCSKKQRQQIRTASLFSEAWPLGASMDRNLNALSSSRNGFFWCLLSKRHVHRDKIPYSLCKSSPFVDKRYRPIDLLRRIDLSSNKRNQCSTDTRTILCNANPNPLLTLCANLGYCTQCLANVLFKVWVELD